MHPGLLHPRQAFDGLGKLPFQGAAEPGGLHASAGAQARVLVEQRVSLHRGCRKARGGQGHFCFVEALRGNHDIAAPSPYGVLDPGDGQGVEHLGLLL